MQLFRELGLQLGYLISVVPTLLIEVWPVFDTDTRDYSQLCYFEKLLLVLVCVLCPCVCFIVFDSFYKASWLGFQLRHLLVSMKQVDYVESRLLRNWDICWLQQDKLILI